MRAKCAKILHHIKRHNARRFWNFSFCFPCSGLLSSLFGGTEVSYPPQTQHMSRLSKLYLLSYNSLQCLGWALALSRVLGSVLATKSIHGAYASAGDLICLLQTISFLEVIHAAIGLVSSGAVLALMQWGGRTHFLLAIVRQIPEVQNLPSVFITFTAWSISELEVVPQFFGLALAKRVLATAVPIFGGLDVRVWSSTCTSRAVTRDLYNVLRGEACRMINATWIWRLCVHPRIQLFLWKVAWRRLPTRTILHARGMDIPLLYPSRCAEEESLDYVLFLCLKAR
ncbi:uncharacterized protein [Elaeis guineensis]|uniref:uncharacterized protein isoform X1 n=1 Tax=Elaeis guineensis var. tenera TaxID=51953 RepID=UPI003C6D45F8